MKAYFIFVITLLLLLVGCTPKTWQKDGINQHAFNKDKLACEAEANAAGYGHNVFNLCMHSKGYSLK